MHQDSRGMLMFPKKPHEADQKIQEPVLQNHDQTRSTLSKAQEQRRHVHRDNTTQTSRNLPRLERRCSGWLCGASLPKHSRFESLLSGGKQRSGERLSEAARGSKKEESASAQSDVESSVVTTSGKSSRVTSEKKSPTIFLRRQFPVERSRNQEEPESSGSYQQSISMVSAKKGMLAVVQGDLRTAKLIRPDPTKWGFTIWKTHGPFDQATETWSSRALASNSFYA